jgi:sec-independent protein translocase protein TatA
MNHLSVILGVVGPQQVILIIVILLLLFGGKKIPELMRGLGSGIKEFKNAAKEDPDQTLNRKNFYKNYKTVF